MARSDIPPTGTTTQSEQKTLADLIAASIKATGPITVASFMRTCLLDPSQGYYASANASENDPVLQHGRDVLGARGDFITSPEISQVFGELLAVYFVARWQASGAPSAIRLVELGPGKGTLLADMIRTFARFPVLNSLKTIHLVETSEGLMRLQLAAIESALSAAGKRIAMPDADPGSLTGDEVMVEYFPLVDSLPVLPDQWTMLVAHEFFDALPIHIFEKTVQGWREVLVDVTDRQANGSSPAKQSGVTTIKVSDLRGKKSQGGGGATGDRGQFRHVLSPTETPWARLLAASNPRLQSLQPGQRVEISPESWAAARKVGELVAGRPASMPPAAAKELGQDEDTAKKVEADRIKGSTAGGAALIVDYGDEKAFGGSFRAFKSHAIVDPLEKPGTADLTANVDFAYLKNALATTDARSMGPMFQSHFLASLGLSQRVEALVRANAASPEKASGIESAAKRLVDPTGMGGQYKVLGIDGAKTMEGGQRIEVTEEDKVWPFDFERELRAPVQEQKTETANPTPSPKA
ncbi:unnamed protein product [Parajaminaea phylloscopi]